MITVHLDGLRRQKALTENRDISIRQIAEETGLGFNTVQRLRKGESERIGLDTLDTLCAYFGLTSLCQLMEYTPGAAAAPVEGGDD